MNTSIILLALLYLIIGNVLGKYTYTTWRAFWGEPTYHNSNYAQDYRIMSTIIWPGLIALTLVVATAFTLVGILFGTYWILSKIVDYFSKLIDSAINRLFKHPNDT